jgi:hypothetical protein
LSDAIASRAIHVECVSSEIAGGQMRSEGIANGISGEICHLGGGGRIDACAAIDLSFGFHAFGPLCGKGGDLAAS